MPTSSSDQGLVLPIGGDSDDVPQSFLDYSSGVESRLAKRYLSSTDRGVRNPAPAAGELSYLADTGEYDSYTGSLWVPGFLPVIDEAYSTTPIAPATSTANTDVVVLTLSSLLWVNNIAYLVEFGWRGQMNGSANPCSAWHSLRRNDASGTRFYRPGNQTPVSTNFFEMYGKTIVKRTGGSDTTQTICLVIGFSGTGSPTSIDFEVGTDAPGYLRRMPVGLASSYPSAIEIPTV